MQSVIFQICNNFSIVRRIQRFCIVLITIKHITRGLLGNPFVQGTVAEFVFCQQWFCKDFYSFFINCPFSCLQYAQILCKILFHRCQVHFIKTEEEWGIWISQCFVCKSNEICKFVTSGQGTVITEQFSRIVPVRFYLNKTIIAWSRAVLFSQLFGTRHKCQLLNLLTFTCSRDACKK